MYTLDVPRGHQFLASGKPASAESCHNREVIRNQTVLNPDSRGWVSVILSDEQVTDVIFCVSWCVNMLGHAVLVK